ncbi:MAG TPA: hypothetical protein VNI77_05670 [Nitrososphaera sp.]|nr:hypothetical protein [Nitrososphaera sp.]
MTRIYALWLREFKVLREKSRLVASTFTPKLWLFVIGSGLGTARPVTITSIDYQQFILPRHVAMSIIFSSVFLARTSFGIASSTFSRA